ncbi:unnamed protein product [Allacma fusca]|uniref:Uncharacterized protein n=1 Tax=Allacma fusca TaxID=39272 RepID=A0A8J2J681_9HEXA|nr:unnamed protein product [Allacma fusca]
MWVCSWNTDNRDPVSFSLKIALTFSLQARAPADVDQPTFLNYLFLLFENRRFQFPTLRHHFEIAQEQIISRIPQRRFTNTSGLSFSKDKLWSHCQFSL